MIVLALVSAALLLFFGCVTALAVASLNRRNKQATNL